MLTLVPSSMFERLLSISHESVQARRFEVAYHALVAAMHTAKHDGDLVAFDQVQQVLDAHAGALDEIEPAHWLSSVGAEKRGTHSLYQPLRQMLEMIRPRVAAGGTEDGPPR